MDYKLLPTSLGSSPMTVNKIRSRAFCFAFASLVILVFCCPVAAVEASQSPKIGALREHQLTGPVVSVIDGDTIDVLHNNRPERIRLSGIDCPEGGQAFGKKAKQAASALTFGKEVTLQTHGKDERGRTLGDVFLPDGTNVNHELVKQGWCWWYRKYAPGDAVLEGLEKDARVAKKGLWVDPAPIPPWAYRKARRGQAPDSSDLVPLDTETESSTSSRGPPTISPLLGAPVDPDSASSTYRYPVIGNRKSHIYHRPDCPNYSQVAPKNRVEFTSAADAEGAGYRVAGNCP